MSLDEVSDSASVMDLDEGETMSEERPTSTSNSHSVTPNLFDDESTPPSTRAQSETPAVAPAKNGRGKKKKKNVAAQLIGHLPRAEKEALETFEELEDNNYQYQTLGRSREAGESMVCECSFIAGQDDPDTACGESSDCINRLTQVECVEGECRCRAYCKNQRMQRKQHANIEVVLTERKGFGLRAGSDIGKDAFIYEYIGDVVNHAQFTKRMREYAEEGLRHFYFMMLQKDEYIDATKKGGIGRFVNHSCNPNCYVAKWTVGKRVRMGIYAKRNILKDEELTFNYNVDRYGHDPQPCYCGESNCVGFLGGKTQTDVAAMDDLYLDALGITDEVESQGFKGTKKKKSKRLDEDYNPTLRPLTDEEVPKVIQAIRQSESREVLLKLFTRIKITKAQSPLRQLMRLRGYSIMCNILEDYCTDVEICTNLLDCILDWPLMSRSKIVASNIEDPVQRLIEHEDETLRSLAKEVLGRWKVLADKYRIPKRPKTEGEDASVMVTEEFSLVSEREALSTDLRNKRTRYSQDDAPSYAADFKKKMLPPVPEGMNIVHPLTEQNLKIATGEVPPPPPPPPRPPRPMNAYGMYERDVRLFPPIPVPPVPKPRAPSPPVFRVSSADIHSVIEEAKKAAEREKREAERLAAQEAKKAKEREERDKRKSVTRDKAKKKNLTSEEKEALKEKKLLKLVGAVVVKSMSKYSKQIDRDTFKKHAKELTQIIADKEKKSHSYQSGKLDSLSEEKVIKIKKFAKEYIAKLLRRLDKSGSRSMHTTDPRARRDDRHYANDTPQSDRPSGSRRPDAPEDDDGDIDVNDTLDLSLDDDHDLEDDDNSGDPSPATDVNGPEPAVFVVIRDKDIDVSRHREKYLSPSTTSGSPSGSKGKRSRWDQRPDDVISPSVINPESLYDGL